MLDNVMVVMQLQGLGIHGLVEGPGISSMLLGQHLLKDAVTVFQVFRELAFLACMLGDLSIFQVFLWWFDGPASTFPPSHYFCLLGV